MKVFLSMSLAPFKSNFHRSKLGPVQTNMKVYFILSLVTTIDTLYVFYSNKISGN